MGSDTSPCFKFIRNFLGGGTVGVEIGVADGGNAEVVLSYLEPTEYYMIDPWEVYPGYNTNFVQEDFDAMYKVAVLRTKNYSAAKILRMASKEASELVPNNLDFVYVDGNHAYDFKMLDMELWYPKIRSGGVLCGDDYNLESTQKVVSEFCDKYNLSFETSPLTPPHPPEFWIVKP